MALKCTRLLVPLLLTVGLSGCAADSHRIAAVGDSVGIQFTCRLPNGEMAVSTDPDAGKREPVSRIYLKRQISDPLAVEAGSQKKQRPALPRLAFESDVAERLAATLVGAKEGATFSTELVADRIAGLPENEQFVTMAKVRKRAKEMRLTPEIYKTRTGTDPAVDQPFVTDSALPGKVIKISGDEVLIRFTPVKEEIDLPFGKGIIREKADRFEIDIQAVPGSLVRTAGLIGRITSVDNEMITIDYGHPFGGEKLRCDVTVATVNPAPKNTAQQDSPPVITAGTAPAAGSGDLVTANYTVTLEDGSLVATTLKMIAADPAVKKVPWYREPAEYAPVELVAGKQAVMPGLAEALVGMHAGDKRRLTLTPDKAFGMPDANKTEQFPCTQTFPKIIRMPADEFVKRFSSSPVLNMDVELFPYFKSRVAEVTEKEVTLEFQVSDGATFNDTFGSVSIAVAGDKITSTLKPQVGSPFPYKEDVGIISASDGITFTVDFNHPLAGRTIVLELEVVSALPVAGGLPIDWIDDHDAGLAAARQAGKPAVMILYADWCGYCKKLFNETMSDPRISSLRDRFTWIRVDSDKLTEIKNRYGQDGYPMIVLFRADGTLARKLDGYQEAAALRAALQEVL